MDTNGTEKLATLQDYLSYSDQALNIAWQRLLAYHQKGSELYDINRRMRFRIIAMTFLASVLAVLISQDFIKNIFGLQSIFRIALVILPIAIAAMATYAIEFSPSVTWIVFSALRDYILGEIYQYRMGAQCLDEEADEIRNEYGEGEISKRQEALIRNTSRKEVAKIIPVQETKIPHWINDKVVLYEAQSDLTKIGLHADVKKFLHWTPKEEDGYRKLSTKQYIEYRALAKRNYYVYTSRNQFKRRSRYFASILIISGLGSILAGISAALAWGVVITTAAVTLITASYEFGNTIDDQSSLYEGIYKIDNILALWRVLPASRRDDAEVTIKLVRDCEAVFRQENLDWHTSALRLQSAADNFMMQNIRDLAGDDIPELTPEQEKLKTQAMQQLTHEQRELVEEPRFAESLNEAIVQDNIKSAGDIVSYIDHALEEAQQLEAEEKKLTTANSPDGTKSIDVHETVQVQSTDTQDA